MPEPKVIEYAEAEPVTAADIPKSSGTPADDDVETGTELVAFAQGTGLELFHQKKGLDPVIEEIRRRAKSVDLDVSTPEGRRRIGSVAREVGSAKMRLIEKADELTEEWRTRTATVNEEKKRAALELDALRDEILAPRKEFDQKNKDRIDAHESVLAYLTNLSTIATETWSAEEFDKYLTDIEREVGRDWQEFKARGDQAIEKARTYLTEAKARRVKAIADAEELAEHRRKEEERQKKERDDEIARVARESALKASLKLLTDAEATPDTYSPEQIMVVVDNFKKTYAEVSWQESQAQAEEAFKRVLPILQQKYDTAVKKRNDYIEAENKRLDDIRIEALNLKLSSLLAVDDESFYANEKSSDIANSIKNRETIYRNTDWQEFSGVAKNNFESALNTLNGQFTKAKKREDDAEAERQKKIQTDADNRAAAKVKADQEETDRQTKLRQENEEHRRTINNAAKDALIKSVTEAGLVTINEAQAIAIVKAIALEGIPNVRIIY